MTPLRTTLAAFHLPATSNPASSTTTAMTQASRRLSRTLPLAAIVVVGLFFGAQHLAASILKGQIEKALGPRGEVREISVGLRKVEILGLRLPAGEGGGEAWPVPDLLRAERVLVSPALLDILQGRIGIDSIRIEGAYVSMLRTRKQQLKVLPGLSEAPTPAAPARHEAAPTAIRIGRIELASSAIDFFDASIRQPPLRLSLEQIDARIDDIALPELKGQSRLLIRGVLKGPKQDGRIEIAGHAEFASKDSEIRSELRGVDLLALRPYLMRATDTAIRRGSMDLDIDSTVKGRQLHAPGKLTLHQLELAGGGTLMGIPQSALVGLMKDRNGTIGIDFSLDGNLDDPRFSLNDQLINRFATGLADALGISLGGLATGMSGSGKDIVQGIGQGLGKLFGK